MEEGARQPPPVPLSPELAQRSTIIIIYAKLLLYPAMHCRRPRLIHLAACAAFQFAKLAVRHMSFLCLNSIPSYQGTALPQRHTAASHGLLPLHGKTRQRRGCRCAGCAAGAKPAGNCAILLPAADSSTPSHCRAAPTAAGCCGTAAADSASETVCMSPLSHGSLPEPYEPEEKEQHHDAGDDHEGHVLSEHRL